MVQLEIFTQVRNMGKNHFSEQTNSGYMRTASSKIDNKLNFEGGMGTNIS